MRSAGFKARLLAVFLLFGGLFAAAPAYAVQPDEIMPNSQLEARARALSAQLRCLVCRNENIDDSNAPLARDLRLLVRERLAAGDTDAQVLNFMVARYGRYVLLRPPFFGASMVLWLFPFALFLSAIVYLFYAQRQAKARRKAPVALTAAEEAELAALLKQNDGAPAEKTRLSVGQKRE